MTTEWQENLVEKLVTYTLNLNGQVIWSKMCLLGLMKKLANSFFLPLNGGTLTANTSRTIRT